MDVTIYHNPRCSKSRATLALIEARGLEPTVIEYLKDTPDRARLARLGQLLGTGPRGFVRKGEDVYRELGLDDASDDALLDAMVAHPILIERPLVVVDDERAALGRPPENVLDIL